MKNWIYYNVGLNIFSIMTLLSYFCLKNSNPIVQTSDNVAEHVSRKTNVYIFANFATIWQTSHFVITCCYVSVQFITNFFSNLRFLTGVLASKKPTIHICTSRRIRETLSLLAPLTAGAFGKSGRRHLWQSCYRVCVW